jgi:5'-deoxynucleotidase YfbR-like HD superfamily hydrolase
VSSAIQTFTGALVDPLAPDPAAIDPVDVAHALSHHCRFGGHSRVFYSVAQHSCLVADTVEAGGGTVADTLWALLHDATEAYLGDLPHPLKHRSPLGAVYREAEERLQAAICERFGLPLVPPPSVKQADRALLATERRALMVATPDAAWPELDGIHPLALELVPWAPQHAATEFLARLERLERAR